ncbi:MAG: hypothetical protein WAN35_13045 [Terracidiphilus sp.]
MSMRQTLSQGIRLGIHSNEATVEKHGLTKEFKAYYASLLVVLMVILVPIWAVDYPGLVDYPGHLARCFVLAHYHDNPVWQQRYGLVLAPAPNLAIDLIVTPLVRLLPLQVCGKIFLSLTAALFVFGCSEVGRAITDRPNWLALVCAFMFYNSNLLYGFVNYCFGLGLFLCVFALWLRLRDHITPLRFLLFCLLSIAAFLAHLSSVVLLGVACCTVALIEFARDRKLFRMTAKVGWLACPALLMAAYMKHDGQAGTVSYRLLLGKLITLLAPVRSYDRMLDVIVAGVLLLSILLIARGSRIHLPAAVSLVFFILYMITPFEVLNTSGVDTRYVVPAFLLLILSIEVRWGRLQKVAYALALAAMAVHLAQIADKWRILSDRSEQIIAMGQNLPIGASVYVFVSETGQQVDLASSLDNVIQLWTVSRQANVSSFFAQPGVQPLGFRQTPCGNQEWAKCIASYDYIWSDDPPPSLWVALTAVATPASTWQKFTLWRIKPSIDSYQRIP